MSGTVLFYDCEIQKLITNDEGVKIKGLEYASSWQDYDNLGIAVISYGLVRNDMLEFVYSDMSPGFEDFTQAIAQYNAEGVAIGGFNSKSFDDNLLNANGIEVKSDYDLLEQVRVSSYGSPFYPDQPHGWDLTLQAIAESNGMQKPSSQVNIPYLWQQGKKSQVADLCEQDVRITAELYLLGINGNLINPNTNNKIMVSKA